MPPRHKVEYHWLSKSFSVRLPLLVQIWQHTHRGFKSGPAQASNLTGSVIQSDLVPSVSCPPPARKSCFARGVSGETHQNFNFQQERLAWNCRGCFIRFIISSWVIKSIKVVHFGTFVHRFVLYGSVIKVFFFQAYLILFKDSADWHSI